MIDITISIILGIRVVFLFVAAAFFTFGAVLSWWETTQNNRNGVTKTLGRFSLSSAIVFLTTSFLAGLGAFRVLEQETFGWVVAIISFLSLVALIDMNRSAYYLALELFKLEDNDE